MRKRDAFGRIASVDMCRKEDVSFIFLGLGGGKEFRKTRVAVEVHEKVLVLSRRTCCAERKFPENVCAGRTGGDREVCGASNMKGQGMDGWMLSTSVPLYFLR